MSSLPVNSVPANPAHVSFWLVRPSHSSDKRGGPSSQSDPQSIIRLVLPAHSIVIRGDPSSREEPHSRSRLDRPSQRSGTGIGLGGGTPQELPHETPQCSPQ